MPTQRHTGLYNLKQLNIINFSKKTISIKAALIKLDIQADLFNNCLLGSIQLRDKGNFVQNIPLIGEELLELKYEVDSESEERSFIFYMYNNVDIEKQGADTFIYTINFCSAELLKNRSMSISEGFVNTDISSLVKNLCNRIGSKELDIEETSNTVDYVAPNISPFEIINYMSARAVSKKAPNSAVYVFFEDMNGFNFKTIDSMMKEKPKYSYYFNHKTESNTNFGVEYFSVNKWKVDQQYDVLDNMNKGLYGMTAYSLNPFTREYKKYVYDYFSDSDYIKTNHIDSENPKNRLHTSAFMFKDFANNFNKFGMVGSHQTGKLEKLGVRYSQINQITNSYKLILEVPGNSELLVGTVLDVNFLNFSVDHDSTPHDIYLKGKYLVTASRHIFTQSEYHTVVEVIKDSYYSDHEQNDRIGMVSV